MNATDVYRALQHQIMVRCYLRADTPADVLAVVEQEIRRLSRLYATLTGTEYQEEP